MANYNTLPIPYVYLIYNLQGIDINRLWKDPENISDYIYGLSRYNLTDSNEIIEFCSQVSIIKAVFDDSIANLDSFFNKFMVNIEELHSNNMVVSESDYQEIANLKKIQYEIIKIENSDSLNNKDVVVPVKIESGYKIEEDIIGIIKQYDIYQYTLLYELYKYILQNF